MDDCQKIDLEFEDDDLIDEQFSVGLSTEKHDDNGIFIIENDNLPELHESVEPGSKRKTGRCNLRKSLAWDSAFFTSAGVLDAEELTTMITGADKCEKRLLPGIQEEMTESTESLSSLGSDTLTMGTLEDDLFVDIRASIQRSSKRVMDSRVLISKIAAMEIDSADISSPEKEDTVSQNKVAPVVKPGLKNHSSRPTVGMSNCQPKQNIGKLGSVKPTKPDPDHSQTSVAKVGEKKSVLPKPSNTIIRPIPSSTTTGKRESIGTGRARATSGISNPGKGTQPPKVSSLSGPRRGLLPKSAISSNNSVLVSSTTSSVHSDRSSTSSDSSSNLSSRTNPGKSNLMIPRRNTGKSGDVGVGPIPKTPSRATLKSKVPSSTSTLSAYMTSNNISSSVSPASSISEWSSVSSSSSCRSMKGDITHLDLRNHPAKQNADDGHMGLQGVGLTSNILRNSSTQSGGSLHAPGKPSGLRMPSHKFGFFDGGKSSIRSPNRPQHSPSAVPNGIPKNGIQIRTSNIKPKTAKAPTATSPATIKTSSPKPTHPVSFQQKPHAFIASNDVIKSPISSVGVKGGSASEEIRHEADKVETRDGVKELKPSCEGTEKENSYDKSTYHKVNGSIEELVGDMSACRAPLALKNSFTSYECYDMPKEFVTQVADRAGFLLPASESNE